MSLIQRMFLLHMRLCSVYGVILQRPIQCSAWVWLSHVSRVQTYDGHDILAAVLSPLGLTTYDFAQSSYLGQTNLGFVSWQGKLSLLETQIYPSVYRICSKLGDTLLNVSFIRNGLSPIGVDIFETYQSMRLVNKKQPKTSFWNLISGPIIPP